MRVLAAVSFVLASCVQLDPSKPIDLVADPAWSSDDVATLANAAACWNLQFGTQLEVVARPNTAQTVFFDYDVLACWGSWGRYMPGEPAHVGVCPVADMIEQNEQMAYHFANAVLLFTVVEHELGHAVGVLGTSRDQLAVMGLNSPPTLASSGISPDAFSDLDFQLFHDAAPSFIPQPTCARVQLALAPVGEAACFCP